MTTSELGALTWPEVAERAATTLLVIPLGATEQHGPHLPLSTDTDVAAFLARRLCAHRGDALVAPAVPYGSSGEHGGFPGTLSIGQGAVEFLLVELVRSADAFAGVLVVSGHGGNAEPLSRAVALLRSEGRQVRAWAPRAGRGRADAHAGWVETSVVMALAPVTVRTERAEAGTTAPLANLVGELRSGGVAAVSANGVLGDPTGASAEDGRRLLDEWTIDLVAAVAGWP